MTGPLRILLIAIASICFATAQAATDLFDINTASAAQLKDKIIAKQPKK